MPQLERPPSKGGCAWSASWRDHPSKGGGADVGKEDTRCEIEVGQNRIRPSIE
jgi:hypothetical protein